MRMASYCTCILYPPFWGFVRQQWRWSFCAIKVIWHVLHLEPLLATSQSLLSHLAKRYMPLWRSLLWCLQPGLKHSALAGCERGSQAAERVRVCLLHCQRLHGAGANPGILGPAPHAGCAEPAGAHTAPIRGAAAADPRGAGPPPQVYTPCQVSATAVGSSIGKPWWSAPGFL